MKIVSYFTGGGGLDVDAEDTERFTLSLTKIDGRLTYKQLVAKP